MQIQRTRTYKPDRTKRRFATRPSTQSVCYNPLQDDYLYAIEEDDNNESWYELLAKWHRKSEHNVPTPDYRVFNGILILNGNATSINPHVFTTNIPRMAQEIIIKVPNSSFARDALSNV